MNITPSIFRNYDIRGLVPEEITSVFAEHVGKGFGSWVIPKFGKNVVVGHDNRKTSQELKDKFVFGLMSAGCNVTDIGLSLTPIVQFLTFDKRFDAGVIVTASHNPKEYNGFRFAGRNAVPIYADELRQIYELILSENYLKAQGDISYEDCSSSYEEYLRSSFSFKSSKKVLLDCGNGTSSVMIGRIFKMLGIESGSINCNLDSDYPHGIPDPENPIFMGELSRNVASLGYDIGFAYDTDGDRFGVVDELGGIYSNDKVLLLLAKDALGTSGSKKIVFDVKSTGLLDEYIRKFGGVPEMIKTGHPYFIEAIKNGAVLGAEYSGHTFFGDRYYGFDDGIYASLRVFELLDKTGMSLSQLMAEFPRTYHCEEIKIPVPESKKIEIMENALKALSGMNPEKILRIDGARVILDSRSWFLIRPSNTSPYLSVRLESDSKQQFTNMQSIISQLDPVFEPVLTVPIQLS